ncbi:MAG TPA: glycosyltransferase N-terminal domain-containing protein [Gemmataceae bacterium]|nr:glycosyltransferase N-terminal domain-containing protein [Gemmataceae bacterium]
MRLALKLYDVGWGALVACWLVFRLICRHPYGFRAVADRLGYLARRPPGAPVAIWVHAVSVGELLSARPVFVALKQRHPDWWILLTTNVPQAYELARSQRTGADAVCWWPWDFGPCTETALGRVRPDLFVLVECELWPNLICRAAWRGVGIVMMNGRIYERNLSGYLRGRRFFADLLRRISFIGAQSEGDYRRFRLLGADEDRLALTGSTKFDVTMPVDLDSRLTDLRALLPLGAGPLWVLASTHDDEESQVLSRSHTLRARFPGLQFLIAPRHIGRATQVAQVAARFGLRTAFRSRLSSFSRRSQTDADVARPDVILLDTIGELPLALGLADLVFVGGTLVDRGGHNPIEAGLHGKAVLVGPSVYNFAEVFAALLSGGAAVSAADADELTALAVQLLADTDRRQDLGRRAAEVVGRHAGAARTYVRVLEQAIGRQHIGVAASRENCFNTATVA